MSAALLILMSDSILAASPPFFFLSLCVSCRVWVNDKLLSFPMSYIIYNFRFTCLPWDTSWSSSFSSDNNLFPNTAPLSQLLQVSESSPPPAKVLRVLTSTSRCLRRNEHGKEWLGCNKPAYLPHCVWKLFFFLSGCTCISSRGRCGSFRWWW